MSIQYLKKLDISFEFLAIIFYMEKYYSMPCLYGVCFYYKKNSACCFVDEKGSTHLISKKNRAKLIYHNIIFLRGIEYFIFGLYFFIKNLIKMPFDNNNKTIVNKISAKLKIDAFPVALTLVMLLSIFVAFLIVGFFPIKIAVVLSNHSASILLNRFLVAVIKIAIVYALFLCARFLIPFRQFYRFNGCANLLLDSNNNIHKPTNFLNYIIVAFIFNFVVLSLIGLTSDQIWKPFVNLLISILNFAISYEILLLLENSKLKWLKHFCIITSFLVTEQPSKTEIYIAETALGEVKFMQNQKRGEVNTELLRDNEVGFSGVYAECKERLKNAGITDKSEVDWLICEVLGTNRGNLRLLTKISLEQKKKIDNALQRRINGEPLTKIFGRTEFYGLEFKVTKDVLSPRMETEILVENVIKNTKPKSRILDIGTGSGIIAICVAKFTKSSVVGVDISQKALDIAKYNATKNQVNVDFKLSNLFENLKSVKKFDIIVSNPPYIPSKDIVKLDVEVKEYDPKLALDGGEDGLDFYRKIIEQSPKFLNKNGKLMFEIGIKQSPDIVSLLQKDFEDIQVIKDYNKIDRVIVAKIKGKRK